MPSPSVQHLANSKLSKGPQMELMGGDVDLASFNLMMRNKAGIKLTTAITDATIARTIDGASTLTVIVDDDLERTIQKSGRLGRHVDVNINGLWFTLVGISKTGRQLTLTFEEREVNVLRYYDKFIMADRSQVRRTEFVLRMIQEVKEIGLKWVIPELHDDSGPVSDLTQPGDVYVTPSGRALVDPATTAAPAERGKGIPAAAAGLTVKGVPITLEQLQNANTILDTCVRSGANGKVMVVTIMVAITESTIHNYTNAQSDPGTDSVGVFQQRPSQGWPGTRNIATDAAEFIKRCMARDKLYPNENYAQLAQDIQHSKYSDGRNYAPWQGEAEKIVTAYGATIPKDKSGSYNVSTNNVMPPSSNGQAQYYMRGTVAQHGDQSNPTYVLTPENSWDCMRRLANEVNWRCFCVSGTIYFISEEWLFRSKPFMTINEDHDGIDWIDYDYVEGKAVATVTVSCHLSRWSAPPGSVVAISGQGNLVDGRYLVYEVTRSLYNTTATITLHKPRPELPEPTAEQNLPQGFTGPPAPAGARNGGVEKAPGTIQQRVVQYARSMLGLPYVYGAEDPGHSFDCSGLAQAAYSSVGIGIPRVAADQYAHGPIIPQGAILQPGDLVFFNHETDPKYIHHVGIYIGGGDMIDAPHTGAFVRVDSNFQTTWGDYYGATRPWQTSGT